MTRLGLFEVHEELARGGMGVVLRGVHVPTGLPVAVKVISAELATSRFYEDFQREVQAAARLDHPNVVTLFDYGVITSEAERASGGALVARSPYLIMELASSGSLADREPDNWPALRRHLEALLEALAHAHAHGLIHRDLKPGNVLLHHDGSGLPTVKLADFGIAHASDRRQEGSPDLEQIAGTPHYMPPEQIECRWRDYGPWTDLYAFGIMAFQLVTGALPYDGEHVVQLLFRHLTEPLPPMQPRFPVPRGLEAWIERLCRKKPEDRFQRAADALAALRALDEPSGRSVDGTSAPSRSFPSVSRSSWTGMADGGDVVASPTAIVRPARPPIPADWRQPERPSPKLLGAGLGLYFLRPVPLVGRTAERDALWAALRECDSDRRARAIVLQGASGTGKSRLAAWICERAHETGAATILRAVHESSAGPSHGLPRLLATHYRAVGLTGEPLRARIAQRLALEGGDEYERDAIAALIDGSADTAREAAKRSPVRFASPTERHVVVENALARATSERAVIVWLDDVQWGGDSLAMVRHALDALEAPVLFILTASDDLLGERPRERELIDAIAAHPRGAKVSIGPLSDADGARLVEELLGLSGELAHRVRRRAAGNPLFAVQLVGDWVARGVLQLTPQGFALTPGERAELPDDLHAIWIDRVERVVAGRPAEERAFLELAAILGLRVDRDELDAAWRAWWGRPIAPGALFDALLRAQLVEPTEGGFAFAHGMLRESLVRAATERGHAASMHAACARMLASRGGRGVAARRGHHLAEAGELEAALEPLLTAARELSDASDTAEALETLARREELLAKLSLPDSDERWGLGWVLRADVHRLEWDLASAERWAANALAVAEAYGWTLVRAEALHVLSHVARQGGEFEVAEERNKKALELFHRLGHDEGRARTLLAMAIAARQTGNFSRAEELYTRALELFELLRDERNAGNALLGLAHVARHHKAYAHAETMYERARERFERAGYRSGVSHCAMGRADVQRYRGELESAEAGYREALRIQKSLGSKATFIARLNLGLVLLAQDRFAEARSVFAAELESLAKEGKGAYLGLVHTLLLPCAVATGDVHAFDEHLRAATSGSSMADEDAAWAAERAGRMLLGLDPERARAALMLAEAQWRRVGDEARALDAKRAAESRTDGR